MAHALAVREPYGIWGGLSEDDREQILSKEIALHFRYHLDHYGWAPEEVWVMPGSYQLVKIYWDVLKTSYVLAELNGDPR